MAQVAPQNTLAAQTPEQAQIIMREAGQMAQNRPVSPLTQQHAASTPSGKTPVAKEHGKKRYRWLHVDYYLDIYDKLTQHLDRYWLLEILSLLLATLAFAAIVITLGIHRDKPLPQWPSLISINSLVAIFTAIMKATLMVPVVEGLSQLKWVWFRHAESKPLDDFEAFDMASRGPWGSFLLMLKLRCRHLAVVGAFIMIVSLAIDPFTQQVIEYYPCSITLPGKAASIPRKNIYSVEFASITSAIGNLPPRMNAAIYLGLVSPPEDVSSLIGVNCLTGNCTFPQSDGLSYSSLAMCSACDDISNTVEWDFQDSEDGTPLYLPDGLLLNTDDDGVLASRVVDTSETKEPSLVAFEALMWSWVSNSAFATKCRLYPCVKTYSANISIGALVEKEVSSVPLNLKHNEQDYTLGDTSYFLLVTDVVLKNGKWQNCTAVDHHVDGYYSPQQFGNDASSGCVADRCYKYDQYYPQDCIWFQSPLVSLAMKLTISEFFENQTVAYQSSPYSDPHNGDGPPASFQGQLWMQNLYNGGNANITTVENYMASLADTITATMRQTVVGEDPGVPLEIINEVTLKTDAYGTVLELQTCIRVHWPWLSLPASLLLLTYIFLAATAAQTPMRLLPEAWKSSSLAALFFGLSTQTIEKCGAVTNMDDITEKARHMRAELRHEGHGWKIVTSETA